MNSTALKIYGNTIEFPTNVKPDDKVGKVKNVDFTRSEARNGEVKPIKNIEDVHRISEYFWNKGQYRNWCLFNMGINTAFRASDLLRMKVSDFAYVDENGKLKVKEKVSFKVKEKKTKKYRTVIIPKEMLDIVQTYLKKDDRLKQDSWLFPSWKSSGKKSLRTNGGESVSPVTGIKYTYTANPKKSGDPLSVSSFGDIMKGVQRDLNLPYNLGTHSCRKTFGYHYIMNHQDNIKALAWLQKSLNHSSQAITLRYIGLDEEDDEMYYSEICYGNDTHNEE